MKGHHIVISDSNKNYIFSLYQNSYVGKFIITIKENFAYIESISIIEEFRGNDLSTLFWKDIALHLSKLDISKVSLIAKEDSERPGKLVNIYEKWGFKKDEKVRYESVDYHTFIYQPMSKILTSSL
jgi:hypothetical protein